jgi:hypothetical protein
MNIRKQGVAVRGFIQLDLGSEYNSVVIGADILSLLSLFKTRGYGKK